MKRFYVSRLLLSTGGECRVTSLTLWCNVIEITLWIPNPPIWLAQPYKQRSQKAKSFASQSNRSPQNPNVVCGILCHAHFDSRRRKIKCSLWFVHGASHNHKKIKKGPAGAYRLRRLRSISDKTVFPRAFTRKFTFLLSDHCPWTSISLFFSSSPRLHPSNIRWKQPSKLRFRDGAREKERKSRRKAEKL